MCSFTLLILGMHFGEKVSVWSGFDVGRGACLRLLNSMGSILESVFKCPASAGTLAISRMAPTCHLATGFSRLDRPFGCKKMIVRSERKCVILKHFRSFLSYRDWTAEVQR